MEDRVLAELASTGVVGILLVLTLLALRAKDRELKREMELRIEDAKKFNELAMSLQKEVITAVARLGEMLEWLEKSSIDAARGRDSWEGRKP